MIIKGGLTNCLSCFCVLGFISGFSVYFYFLWEEKIYLDSHDICCAVSKAHNSITNITPVTKMSSVLKFPEQRYASFCTCVDDVCKRCKGEGGRTLKDNSFVTCGHCAGYGSLGSASATCIYCDSIYEEEYKEEAVQEHFEEADQKYDTIQQKLVIESYGDFQELLASLCEATFEYKHIDFASFPLVGARFESKKKTVNCSCEVTRAVQQTIMEVMSNAGKRLFTSNGRRAPLTAILDCVNASSKQNFEVVVSNNGQKHCDYNFEVKSFAIKQHGGRRESYLLRMLNLHLTVM